jgi:hypothetical protein
LSFRSDDLDSVGELYTDDELRQLVVAIEAAPASLGCFCFCAGVIGKAAIASAALGKTEVFRLNPGYWLKWSS